MGRELVDGFPVARELFERADKALGFALSKVCFEGPIENLTRTAVAQPAILTVSTICFELWRTRTGSSTSVVAAAGHSLGEYSALVATGALSFEDAVLLVHKRGTYMQEAVPVGQGKMLAVLGIALPDLEEAVMLINSELGELVEIANINAPGQIVVAGRASSIEKLAGCLKGARTTELPVSAPFHCAMMEPAAVRLGRDLELLQINPTAVPVFANVSAKPLRQPDEIRNALHQQVCGRVRWVECMQNSVEATAADLAIEFGTGAVLQGLLKRIMPQMQRKGIDSAQALEDVTLTRHLNTI